MKVINLIQQAEEDRIKAKELADLVNPLVAQAFGEGFRGDYQFLHEGGYSPGAGICYVGREKTRKEYPPFTSLLKEIFAGGIPWDAWEMAGDFMNDSSGKEIKMPQRDGSIITVRPEYGPQARQYAALYEQLFKKEVTIRIKLPK